MCDYSVYEKPAAAPFSMYNPRPNSKNKQVEKVRFKIILLNRKIQIVLCKEDSLEDLYIKIYNAVYPDFSTERVVDSIPPPNATTYYSTLPRIHHVALVSEKEQIVTVPLHKFITIAGFMAARPDCFKNIAYFGMPLFRIYVVDEEYLTKIQEELSNRENDDGSKKKYSCF